MDVESKIKLEKEVVNIAWDPSSKSGIIKIICADGSNYTANHLIFTASLGVLKARHQSLFTPSLPQSKIKTIENIGYGTLGKVFLEFEKPFWSLHDKEMRVYPLLWTDEDLRLIKGTDKEW